MGGQQTGWFQAYCGSGRTFDGRLVLERCQNSWDVLLIDEGFGSLDPGSLDLAVEAFETLQGFGRKVGVVTHDAAMVERNPTQFRVNKRGWGRSVVQVQAA